MKLVVNTKDLDNILKSIKKIISKDEEKPIYNNIKIECSEEKVKFIACDDFRLAINECNTLESDEFECIIPAFDIPKKSKEITTITLENDFITIDFGIYKITYKIIKGEWFDYKYIIKPQKNSFVIGFDAKLLKETLEMFNKDIVKIEIDINNNIAPISITNTKNINNKVLVLPCRLKEGEC